MTRTHIAALMLLVAAAPAAVDAGAYFRVERAPCFSDGATGYRLADNGAADVTVRIDNQSSAPDLRMQIVDDPAQADFVLIDDKGYSNACREASVVRTFRVDAKANAPDLTIAMSSQPTQPGYKIYVHAAAFGAQNAAALFAVILKAHSKREFAQIQ